MTQDHNMEHRRPVREDFRGTPFKGGLNQFDQHDLFSYVSEMNKLLGCIKSSLQISTQGTEEEQEYTWQSLDAQKKQFLLDLFCWKKDEFLPEKFLQLLPLIVQTIKWNSTTALAIFNSYEFHLLLKSTCNFYPFDQEEANYPQDDNYFLSKDFSYVFHFDQDAKNMSELEDILEQILHVVGSEYFISKLQISAADSYLWLEEEAYNARKSRLDSMGYPSYEDALEWQTPIPKNDFIKKNFEKNRIEEKKDSQIIVHNHALIGDNNSKTSSKYELIKTLQAVFEYKKSRIANEDELSSEIMKDAMFEVLYFVKIAKHYLNKHQAPYSEDFKYLYRLGISLFKDGQKQLMQLKTTVLQCDIPWTFLGETIESVSDSILLKDFSKNTLAQNAYNISSIEGYQSALNLIAFFEKNMIVVKQHFNLFKIYQKKNNIMFLNFETEEVNFEILLLSLFINYFTGKKSENNFENYSLDFEGLKLFVRMWNLANEDKKQNEINNFLISLNICEERVVFDSAIKYLHYLVNLEVLDLNYETLNVNDGMHVGSVLLEKIITS